MGDGFDAEAHVVKSQNNQWRYDKLVLATGASAFVPPVPGRELMLTLNSQQEYRACETQLRDARRVLIVGGGLIGSELAMDFCRAGKAVTLIDNAAGIWHRDCHRKSAAACSIGSEMGVHLLLKSQLQGLEKTDLAFWQRWTASVASKWMRGNCRHRTAPEVALHDAPG
ncbi:FAD-dependent oxidoreductase [Shigella flexneri]